MKQITEWFKKILTNKEVNSVIVDYSDIILKQMLESKEINSIASQIPIVKTIFAVKNLSTELYNNNLYRQTCIFVNEFNNNSIDEKKMNNYIKKMDENQKFADEEINRILLLLSSNYEDEKSKIYAKLYKAYYNGKIDWKKFCEFSDITKRIFLEDINCLIKDDNSENYQLGRLMGVGLKELSFNIDIKTGKLIQQIENSMLGNIYIGLLHDTNKSIEEKS